MRAYLEVEFSWSRHSFPGTLVVKKLLVNAEDVKRQEFEPWVGKIP